MKNTYRILEDGNIEIDIKYRGEIIKTYVSPDKLEKLLNFRVRWYGLSSSDNRKVYAFAWFTNESGKKVAIGLHRYLTDCPDHLVPDHINSSDTLKYTNDPSHYSLINLNENLRICSVQENLRNKLPYKNSTSGVTGVTKYKTKEKLRWRVTIYLHSDGKSKSKHIGVYDDLAFAITQRKKAEQKYYA